MRLFDSARRETDGLRALPNGKAAASGASCLDSHPSTKPIMSSHKSTRHSDKHTPERGSASDGDSLRAASGELHQIAGGEHPALTTNQGVALSDNQNSLRANPRGPTLLEDFILREKITHFDHERIPERIVYARATGVHGFFELTASLQQYTTAKILTEVGAKALAKEGAAIDFVRDALGHLKAIAVDAGGQRLLKAANVGLDAGIVDANDKKAFIAAAKTRQWEREKSVRTLA